MTDIKTARENELRYRAGRIITSLVRDSIILSIIHLTDPYGIWRRLRTMCDIRSSSRWLSFKEQLYSFKLREGKIIRDHLQEVNLIVIQLANLGIGIPDEDLADITLNSLPRSWSTFKQIQKGRKWTPSFPELKGLLLQEEFGRKINRQRIQSEELNYVGTGRGGSNYRGCKGRGRSHSSDRTSDRREPICTPVMKDPILTNSQHHQITCHKCGKPGHYAWKCARISLEDNIKDLQLQLSKLPPSRSRSHLQPQHAHLTEVQEKNQDDGDYKFDSPPPQTQECFHAFHKKMDKFPDHIMVCFTTTPTKANWFLESGASSHVTRDPTLLSSIASSHVPSIRTASSQVMPVEYQGTIHITTPSEEIKSI